MAAVSELTPPPIVTGTPHAPPRAAPPIVVPELAAPPVVGPNGGLLSLSPPDDDGEPDRRPPWWLPTRHELLSGLLSSLFHAIVFLILAGLVGTSGAGGGKIGLNASFSESDTDGSPDHPADEVFIVDPTPPSSQPTALYHVDLTRQPPEMPKVAISPQQLRAAETRARQTNASLARPSDLLEAAGDADASAAGAEGRVPGGFSARSSRLAARLAGKGQGIGLRGATGASEEAVERALRWLAAHQLEQGNWSFDHTKGFCQGACGNPGTIASTTGATGLALLPFLGAGYTHKQGEHKDVVRRGLYWLMARARPTDHGLDLQEGTMYAQGLAAIALCEAYAMTKDPALKEAAQGAVDFIVWAQDKKGGGWRYRPGEPGDTTVTGWQLMALKSAQMGPLEVPRSTIYLAEHFLTSVQRDGGARYAYLPHDRHALGTQTTAAIGLLCRMYTGWKRANPGLRRGVALLARWGPSKDDMYYNYYATQVLYHWGGSSWELWNRCLRDYLVSTQASVGHESGSWYFSGPHAQVGGRLYVTAMAALILEVYYRHMPLYDTKVFRDQ